MHGGDQNNAVLKATKDAIHHCCMAGISEIFEITDRKTQAFIKADIYAPHPEEVDPSVVTDCLEWWNVEAEVHQGGANPEGIAQSRKTLAGVASAKTSGITLIVVAGMSYAIYVEGRGKNVLTSAELLAERVVPDMLQQLGFTVKKK